MIWKKHIHKLVLRLPDSWSNWNMEMLVFEERCKPEYPEKNFSEQGREPTTNSTTYGVDAGIWTRATLVGGECSHECATLAPQTKTVRLSYDNVRNYALTDNILRDLHISSYPTQPYSIIAFIIHSEYFPNSDWLKAHA